VQTALKNISAGAPFPGRREDFDSDDAWNHWKSLETTHLSQLMLSMVKIHPDLAKFMPSDSFPPTPVSAQASGRPSSVYSMGGNTPTSRPQLRGSISNRRSLAPAADFDAVAEDIDADDEVPVGHHFTYIPPNPKKYYKRLLEFCLTADLEAMLSDAVNDDDEVSLGILSHAHIELINECALRWRIGQPYRVSCFLDLVKQFYERNDVPLECIPEALQTIERVRTELELDKWPVADVSTFANSLKTSTISLSPIVRLCSNRLWIAFQCLPFQSLPRYGSYSKHQAI
jgi:hypothetical protein